MNDIQNKLFEKHDLTQTETFEIFSRFVAGDIEPISIAAILIALKMKGETPAEVAGAAKAMRENAVKFPRPDYATADSCGTGGSGQHTLNISTLVAFIAATNGIAMVKHGNRSISSKCGSADVLEQLGVKIDMSPDVARHCLDELLVTFLFAPQYHPGVKHVMPVRNQLKTRTIFNLIGPLANPAIPQYQLMGVYSPDYCYAAAESLRLSGCQSAMVVHSCGCDEITLAGPTKVAELRDNKITEYELQPDDFGLPLTSLEALSGGTPSENAKQFVSVLEGTADEQVINTVAANAGTLFYVAGKSDSIRSGVKNALAIIKSGDAIKRLNALSKLSHGSTETTDIGLKLNDGVTK